MPCVGAPEGRTRGAARPSALLHVTVPANEAAAPSRPVATGVRSAEGGSCYLKSFLSAYREFTVGAPIKAFIGAPIVSAEL